MPIYLLSDTCCPPALLPLGQLGGVASLQAHQSPGPSGFGKGSVAGDGVAHPSEEEDQDDKQGSHQPGFITQPYNLKKTWNFNNIVKGFVLHFSNTVTFIFERECPGLLRCAPVACWVSFL